MIKNSLTNFLKLKNVKKDDSQNVCIKSRDKSEFENPLKKSLSQTLLKSTLPDLVKSSKDGEMTMKKKTLKITDKIISVFTIKNKNKNLKSDNNAGYLKTITDDNQHNLIENSKIKNKSSSNIIKIESKSPDEEKCVICNRTEENKSKKVNIAERLNYMNEWYKSQQLSMYKRIDRNSKQIQHAIEKETGRKVENFELKEIIESIMKVEEWLNNYGESV